MDDWLMNTDNIVIITEVSDYVQYSRSGDLKYKLRICFRPEHAHRKLSKIFELGVPFSALVLISENTLSICISYRHKKVSRKIKFLDCRNVCLDA